VIRQAFDEGYDVARTRTGQYYDAAKDATADVRVPVYPVGKEAKSILKDFYPLEALPPPPVLSKAADVLGSKGGATYMSFPELDALRKQVRGYAGDLRNTDRTASAAATKMADALDAQLERLAGSDYLKPHQQMAWQRARVARADQGATFQNQTTKPLSDRGPFGQPNILPGEIPGQFAHTGATAPTDAAAFGPAVNYAGNRPAAPEALGQYMVKKIRDRAISPAGDSIREQALARALSEWEPAMGAVPGLRQKVKDTLTPILSDMESARFARDAGRGVGSNTFQNFAINRSVDALTAGLPISKIPGVTQVASLLTKPIRSSQGYEQRLKEALAAAMMDPQEAVSMMRLARARAPGGTGSAVMLNQAQSRSRER
jgi:hypothetical protein